MNFVTILPSSKTMKAIGAATRAGMETKDPARMK
jgi:hypothetical protein